MVRPLPRSRPATRDLRPDGPLPIAIADFRLAVPRRSLVDELRAAAAAEARCDPPPNLAYAIEQRQAFVASGLLHEQWGTAMPVYRGRRVPFMLDRAFHLTNPGAPLPDEVELDPGDGGGFRPAPFGHDRSRPSTPRGRLRVGGRSLPLRRRVRSGAVHGGAERPARGAAHPHEIWPLPRRPRRRAGHTGRAWVYRASGPQQIDDPVILVEGFPGGHPCDYLYEMLNAAGTLDGLFEAGYDVVLVGLDQGWTRSSATPACWSSACARPAGAPPSRSSSAA